MIGLHQSPEVKQQGEEMRSPGRTDKVQMQINHCPVRYVALMERVCCAQETRWLRGVGMVTIWVPSGDQNQY